MYTLLQKACIFHEDLYSLFHIQHKALPGLSGAGDWAGLCFYKKRIVVEFSIDHIDLPTALILQKNGSVFVFHTRQKEITPYSPDLVIILIEDNGNPHLHFSFRINLMYKNSRNLKCQ